MNMDPALLCRIFFGIGTATNLGGTLIPSFRERIMNYGSRSTDASSPEPLRTPAKLLNYISFLKVPHAWFTHYYVISTASSVFWAHQVLTHGWIYRLLLTSSRPASSGSMSATQVLLAWSMMSIQGTRRLYESITLANPSKSKMWIGIWLIGIAYYMFMGVSVWIEGIKTLDVEKPHANLLEISRPSLKTAIAVPLFLLASVVQHDCHKHLASLKKYSLPENRFFQSVVCPHYTCECLIYVAMAVAAAPQGKILNQTVLAGLEFVATNLAVTADSTRKWYVEKFGRQKLVGRWRMVPYVY